MSIKSEIEKLRAALKKKNGNAIEWYITRKMHEIDPVQFEAPKGPAPSLGDHPEIEARVRAAMLRDSLITN